MQRGLQPVRGNRHATRVRCSSVEDAQSGQDCQYSGAENNGYREHPEEMFVYFAKCQHSDADTDQHRGRKRHCGYNQRDIYQTGNEKTQQCDQRGNEEVRSQAGVNHLLGPFLAMHEKNNRWTSQAG